MFKAATGDGRQVVTCSEKIARQFLNAAQASGRLAALYRIDHTSGSVTQIDGD